MNHIVRRDVIFGAGLAIIGCSAARATWPAFRFGGPSATLMRRATEAFAAHRASFAHDDRFGIVDYAAHSREPRFYLVDRLSGNSEAFLVAHGRGSDPNHTGYLQSFSNRPGSLASSEGTYVTAQRYVGSHGTSRRLRGLDPENSNAEARAIVIHPASYVSEAIIGQQGRLGRSEGCFAFAPDDIETILGQLGDGRMIYAHKI
jgi:hypothetical protein